MSLESWLEEFYPISAEEAAKQGALAAAKHSLHKWRGVLPENREKHDVAFVCHTVTERPGRNHNFIFGCSTCSLCEFTNITCGDCPLTLAGFTYCNDEDSAYTQAHTFNPVRMIKELEATVKWVESQQEGEVA